MSKKNTVFVCSSCGYETSKWQGKCSSCAAWNSLEEKSVESFKSSSFAKVEAKSPISFKAGTYKTKRLSTNIKELDRVLGGGLVKDSLLLLGGEPGIGKSTLALQFAASLSGQSGVLYVSAEESFEQVAMRVARLGFEESELEFLAEKSVEVIAASIKKNKPGLVIVDSVQTITSLDLPGAAGSLSQVRACTETLLELAKKLGVSIVLIGHVTKEGNLAGPKTLEHLVDTVLYLEGDRRGDYRILRASKNRFGSVNEIGIFTMGEKGLEEVLDPSAIFISNQQDLAPGTCITATLEGTRVFMVEIQALTTNTNFGYPKRLATGFNLNRLQLIIAVLTRQAGLKLDNKDVYLKVSGGFNLDDPAADLAVALAIASSCKSKALNKDLLALGEISLSGEIRKCNKLEQRLKEAGRLGYKTLISAHTKGLQETLKVTKLKEAIDKNF